jgi:hypothetical protein
MELLLMAGVDISHARLLDLLKLVEQAKPFFDWVEKVFQTTLGVSDNMENCILMATFDQLRAVIRYCYDARTHDDVPTLFDGAGRTYSHHKACFYFFSWLIRDAPQQRLSPLIQRIVRLTGDTRINVEIEVLSRLILKYRTEVKTFLWASIREVIIDRLEGSRRSLRGHEREAIVRTALITAFQQYFEAKQSYGVFSGIEIPAQQIIVGKETFDVSVLLNDASGKTLCRLLVPIKTRETEGGGHSHLFSRDITTALRNVRIARPNDYLLPIIVAKNWSLREVESLSKIADYVILVNESPDQFRAFSEEEQVRLNGFIAAILEGMLQPKQSSEM